MVPVEPKSYNQGGCKNDAFYTLSAKQPTKRISKPPTYAISKSKQKRLV